MGYVLCMSADCLKGMQVPLLKFYLLKCLGHPCSALITYHTALVPGSHSSYLIALDLDLASSVALLKAHRADPQTWRSQAILQRSGPFVGWQKFISSMSK